MSAAQLAALTALLTIVYLIGRTRGRTQGAAAVMLAAAFVHANEPEFVTAQRKVADTQ